MYLLGAFLELYGINTWVVFVLAGAALWELMIT